MNNIGDETLSRNSDRNFPFLLFACDSSILIKAGEGISVKCHNEVFRIFNLLSSKKIDGMLTIHPAYNSVLVTFDPVKVNPHYMFDKLQDILNDTSSVQLPERRRIEIPVCYENEFAPDIHDVANLRNLTVNEVISYHANPEYLVYFLGFSPGFPYLGNMPKEISASRLKTPRIKIPAGSVAIGGNQTGIYPIASPGGWRIIGRTPLKLFSIGNDPPVLLKMGDKIKFVPITKDEFEKRSKKE